MKKYISLYVFVFLLSFCAFACLLPYPVLSRYTNSTEKQISKENALKETEFNQTESSSSPLLDITWTDGIDILLENNKPYEIYDFKTNQYFFIKRIGGKNHADVIPDRDCDFKFISENISQDEPTPVLLIYNSTTFIPASFTAYMHGYAQPDSTYFGHYCLHFKSSKTTETNEEDYFQQKAIKSAKSQAHKFIKQ